MRIAPLFSGVLAFSLQAFAATAIVTDSQGGDALREQVFASRALHYREILREPDTRGMLHIRLQQTHAGINVWGADAIVHIPEAGHATQAAATLITPATTMQGLIFKNIATDLPEDPQTVYTTTNRQRARTSVFQQYPQWAAHTTKVSTEPLIVIDRSHKAHWALKLVFDIPETPDTHRAKPTWLLDARTFTIFKHWDDLKTHAGQQVLAGGFGGNHKTGQLQFGGPSKLAAFTVTRDFGSKLCDMRHNYVSVHYAQLPYRTVDFECIKPDNTRGGIYWNADFDHTDTTWSPANDVMFGEQMTRQMYMDWYHIPVLTTPDQKPLRLRALVHYPATNAWWDNNEVVFGDSPGSERFNPFTQLDTVAHEISHGFTEQHSNLIYDGESGGINEAFSDMAGIAAEYYTYGNTSFKPGFGDIKDPEKSLRYMDRPSRDCEGQAPGKNCSIDNASQYRNGMNVHFSSGVYNRLYYLLANSPGWNPQKAFDIMVEANRHYWVRSENFQTGACGLLRATRALNYAEADVAEALAKVHLSSSCEGPASA